MAISPHDNNILTYFLALSPMFDGRKGVKSSHLIGTISLRAGLLNTNLCFS